ncbi:MAG: hypothetical protein ACI9TI_001392 [Natronomonas sp.]|jgi:hypothetical protein|uniref:helix-turn-helix domain-containing protein n=1 Tax=Natronomonas sp. TaxID=2184060 RepID=UPI003989AC05
MYDFGFTITYEEGIDVVADALTDNDSVRSERIYACLDPERMWALEFVTGDPDELLTFDELLFDESLDRESIGSRPCDGDRRISQLGEQPRCRMVYTYVSDIGRCDTVPTIATRYFSAGALFVEARTGQTATWQVLAQRDEKIGLLYDTLGARIAEGLKFSFDHLTELDQWRSRFVFPNGFRPEQRDVLVAAAEHGYFETPREVTLEELAGVLDLPRSTVSYRLRRAIAELVETFIDSGP